MNKMSSRILLVLLVIVTLALITGNNLFLKGKRVDLTQDRMFSVSDGTTNIVKTLDNDVELKFFYSE